MTAAPFVVFGYGSLIFKPPPHVISQVPGFLKGFVRRFALKSYDHRGTPENPGRVVTIIHKEEWERIDSSDTLPPEDIVWGVALTIDPSYVDEVRGYLTDRETDYTVEMLNVYTEENGVEKVIIPGACCYISRPDNPSFVRSEPLDSLALLIWRSVGPSGRNKAGGLPILRSTPAYDDVMVWVSQDYLYQLAESMRALAPASYDAHLFTLENKIRQLDRERGENVLCY